MMSHSYTKRVGMTAMLALFSCMLLGQRMEIMPGAERLFFDIQWMQSFDEKGKWSLFSRTRGSWDYDQEISLFSGAYFDYNTSSGFGPTFLARVSESGVGSEVGVHYAKSWGVLSLYALVSLAISRDFSSSLFSIARYQPELTDHWKLYSSLELFSNFDEMGHFLSVQRIRAGLSRNHYQFGLGVNLLGIEQAFTLNNSNPGFFLRKEF